MTALGCMIECGAHPHYPPCFALLAAHQVISALAWGSVIALPLSISLSPVLTFARFRKARPAAGFAHSRECGRYGELSFRSSAPYVYGPVFLSGAIPVSNDSPSMAPPISNAVKLPAAGNSPGPTSRTCSVVGLLSRLRAQFGRVNSNPGRYEPGST